MIKQEIDGKADTVPFETIKKYHAPVDQTLTPHSLFSFIYVFLFIYLFSNIFFGGGGGQPLYMAKVKIFIFFSIIWLLASAGVALATRLLLAA